MYRWLMPLGDDVTSIARCEADMADTTQRTAESRGRWEVEDRLLHVVRELALELHPRRVRGREVTLDSDLDRDLGYDSLGRVELILRLNRAFKIELPDALLGEAETPRALLAAVVVAKPGVVQVSLAEARRPTTEFAESAPAAAGTLLEALDWHVERHPERPHILLWRGENREQTITYSELATEAQAIARGLRERSVEPGSRVAIMLPSEAAFFEVYFAVLFAGAIPVPIYPPFRLATIEDHLRRQAGILRNAQVTTLITNEEIRPLARLLRGLAPELSDIETAARLKQSGTESLSGPRPTAETVALIQYTSGSTGDPKGVVLTHANLLANIRAMGQRMNASPEDVFVSWLPLYHDMGLIGAWLGSLYYAAPVAIMSPLSFLANPARWLWSIHRHRATLSAAPNFAFELCLKYINDADIAGLDLSSLRMVANGAEPVSPSTIARFTERFTKFGFRPEAMAPVYGLAESSVGLAFPPPGRLPIVERIEREALARHGEAVLARPDDASALAFVGCGQPLPGHQVRIVDTTGREVGERREGRLQFRGPSVTRGYFRDEVKTRQLFDGEWLESGDLAYVARGDVFITGRIKDVIIRAGRNIYPHELEEWVGNVPGVRKGCVAVFGSPDPRTGTERVIVMAETRETDEAALDALRRRIESVATDLLELPPDDVALVSPHTVPKTSSGKLRRAAARTTYESGATAPRGRWLWWQLARLTLESLPESARHLARTALEFTYAFYWWGVLGLLAGLVWGLVMVLPRRNWRFALIRWAARLFFRLTRTPFTVEQQAPPPQGGAVIVANHSSYLDAAVLFAALPGELIFTAKQELATQVFAGSFLRRVGTVFVERAEPEKGLEDTRAALDRARAGQRLVFFPEGTLTRMPGLLGFHLGAFQIVATADLPLVPVTIKGTRSVLRGGGQWFPRRGEISVVIGRALRATGDDFQAAVALRDEARAQILKLCGEPDLAEHVVRIA